MDIDSYLSQLRDELDNTISSVASARLSSASSQGHEEAEDSGFMFCPECGKKVSQEVCFCPDCGTCVIDGCDDDIDTSLNEQNINYCDNDSNSSGILLTDTVCMAHKYGIQSVEVDKLLTDYINESKELDIHWKMLDISCYKDVLNTHSWQEYNRIIDRFCEENKICTGPNLSLFIIGGNDVIPIPQLESPYWGDDIPCDMAYCYEGEYLKDVVEAKKKPKLDIRKVRCNVGRLPLQDGTLDGEDLYDDIRSYFNLSNMYATDGIPVETVLMTTHKEWLPASATMSEHLPLQAIDKPSEYVKDGMFVSPDLLTSNEESLEDYIPSLKSSDMLMFNLHGSNSPQQAGFYSYDEAFNPEMLSYSAARVFNTVACFGARYDKYNRNESMLLSALYGGGVLLYTGSMISVPMLQYNEARELLLNPGTGSEVFMRLYSLYLFKGISAGKALLQAKCDYFNLCRHIEEDGFTLATVMMFSLYGNPLLGMKRKEHVIDSALNNDAMPPKPVTVDDSPLNTKSYQRLITRNKNESSLLNEIQDLVDANLASIRAIVEDSLYKTFGLLSSELTNIDSYQSKDEKGYSFLYKRTNGLFDYEIRVETDSSGIIKRVFSTK